MARDTSQRLPFLLSQSALLAPFTNASTPITAFAIEASPLYAGLPVGVEGADASPYGAVGDVLVEPFAASSAPAAPLTRAPPWARSEAAVERRYDLLNLGSISEWAGTATSTRPTSRRARGPRS